MKIAEIRGLSSDEIQAQMDEAREEIMNLRFQQSTGELVDYTKLRQIRRSIARYQTILNERAREAAMEGEE
ncbi:MAG: 50S ribosomal protein L29 [Chloroflexi bacterium]|nr:50S ribosomal protein L29 [Chloroflexota bacterium]